MEYEYSVFCGERCIGNARITTEGLYTHIQCTCEWIKDGIYVLFAQGEHGTIRIGVPVPCGNAMILDTRIPAKRFKGDIQKMYLLEKGIEPQYQCDNLEDGKPIENLADILCAKLRLTEEGAQLVYSISPHKQDLE